MFETFYPFAIFVGVMAFLYVLSCFFVFVYRKMKRNKLLRSFYILAIFSILILVPSYIIFNYSTCTGPRLGTIIEIDRATNCNSTTITTYVRNIGAVSTTADRVQISGKRSDGTTIPSVTCGKNNTVIKAGVLGFECEKVTGTRGANIIVVAGPANTMRAVVSCTG